jgi:hypothetical protein
MERITHANLIQPAGGAFRLPKISGPVPAKSNIADPSTLFTVIYPYKYIIQCECF